MSGDKKEKQVFSWGHERRFNAYSNYFRTLYGEGCRRFPLMPVSHALTVMARKEQEGVLIAIMTRSIHLIASLRNQSLSR